MIEVGGFRGEVIEIGLKIIKFKNIKGEVKIIVNGDVIMFINYLILLLFVIVEFGILYDVNM